MPPFPRPPRFPWLKAGGGVLAGGAGLDLAFRGPESAIGTVAHGAADAARDTGEGVKWAGIAAVLVGAILLVVFLRGK